MAKIKKKKFYDISASIDPKNMILLPFDSSYWDESNGSKIMFLGSLGGEIFAVKVILTWQNNNFDTKSRDQHFESGHFDLESGQFNLFRPLNGHFDLESGQFSLLWPLKWPFWPRKWSI